MFAEFNIQPGAVEQVGKPDPGRFQIDIVIQERGNHQFIRDIFCQNAGRKKIKGCQVECSGRNRIAVALIGWNGGLRFHSENGCGPHGKGRDDYVFLRGVPFRPELIPVVPEGNSKIVEFWKSDMARGAGEVIFFCENGER